MKRILPICVLIFTIGITGCNFFTGPDEPELTPASQAGADTFSCKVNGKVMVAEVEGIYFGPAPDALSVSYHHVRWPKLSVLGTKITSDNTVHDNVIFACDSILSPGTYRIKAGAFSSHRPSEKRYSKLIGDNFVTISHLDTAKRIIAGTFAFVVKDTSGNEVKITDGRFDATYMP
ncbi:MAG: hypothetical protein V4642_02130 [Bacteroidota bacterium]